MLLKILLGDLERQYHYENMPVKKANLFRLASRLFHPRFLPVVLYRISYALQARHLGLLARFFSFLNFFLFGIEIAMRCKIGPGLCFPHTFGTVIGAERIGANAIIYQGVTIGAKTMDLVFTAGSRPVIGDNVVVGSGAKVLGGLTVGDNAMIGANAVVTRPVPKGAVVGGVPAKIIRNEKQSWLNKKNLGSPEVVILMGTYNGARFIQQQIKSIQKQEYANWRLIIRDDGSKDSSMEIVSALGEKDSRIEILKDDLGNLGVTRNFGRLLQYAKEHNANYVAFADQDDVWNQQKLKKQMEILLSREQKHGNQYPLLVYTDLMVVDEKLSLIHQSFMKYQKLRHEDKYPLHVLLVQNFVTGCSVLVNRPLVEFASPVPDQALLHDWWLALCAAVCGDLIILPDSLTYYRQHEGNEVGAKGFLQTSSPVVVGKAWKEGEQRFPQIFEQAKCLHDRIFDRIDLCQCHSYSESLIQKFLNLREFRLGGWGRILKALHLGIHRQTFLTQLIFSVRLFLLREFKKK